MTRLRAALVALSLALVATVVVQSVADDILRAFCAGIGTEHPLYGYLDCARLLTPSPEG